MARADGNGWVRCRCGQRHWGLHGAAGLLLLRRTEDHAEVLLQLRAGWTHQGGSWGVPGGARDSHEDVVAAALREAGEEVGLEPEGVCVVARSVGTDHVDWRYTYVIGWADRSVAVRVCNDESDEIRWVRLDEVEELPLHPALAASWPRLRHHVTSGAGRPRARRPRRSR
ncbi:MAG: NUDIX domain-containing protein [Kineosporiaceae bacterium]